MANGNDNGTALVAVTVADIPIGRDDLEVGRLIRHNDRVGRIMELLPEKGSITTTTLPKPYITMMIGVLAEI